MSIGCNSDRAVYVTTECGEDLIKHNIMENQTVKITSKKDGIVYGSDPSGSMKVSIHGLKKDDYKAIRRGHFLKFGK